MEEVKVELFADIPDTVYVVRDGYRDFASHYDHDKGFYDSYAPAEFARFAQYKDRTISMYDRRWQSAKAVIDLVAQEVFIDPDTTNVSLYGLRSDGSAHLVDAIRRWSDKSGDKAKLKKRVAELENQVEMLKQMLKGGF